MYIIAIWGELRRYFWKAFHRNTHDKLPAIMKFSIVWKWFYFWEYFKIIKFQHNGQKEIIFSFTKQDIFIELFWFFHLILNDLNEKHELWNIYYPRNLSFDPFWVVNCWDEKILLNFPLTRTRVILKKWRSFELN